MDFLKKFLSPRFLNTIFKDVAFLKSFFKGLDFERPGVNFLKNVLKAWTLKKKFKACTFLNFFKAWTF